MGFLSGISLLYSIPSMRPILGLQQPTKTNFTLPYLFAFGTSKPVYYKMKQLYDAINREINK